MVESISKIRQLLAESNFARAQKEAEIILYETKGSESIELLELYFESLKAQSRPLPSELVIILINKLLPQDADLAQSWLATIPAHQNFQRVLLIKIKIAELKGQTEVLYNLLSQYQLARFEGRTPAIPEYIQGLIKKYFPGNFHIQLQRLALDLLRMDMASSEVMIKELILSCFERSSPRGTKEKLNSLYEVLNTADKLYHLEVYKNFCLFMAEGLGDKKDFKKVIELIIYIDDFKFQALLLNFLFGLKQDEMAKDYAVDIRQNKEYSYVYFDKFFPHLKTLFFQRPKAQAPAAIPDLAPIDLKVSKNNPVPMMDERMADVAEEEVLLAHLLKHQNFSTNELLDVAVSFVQSEFYHAALQASQLAHDSTQDNVQRLKAYYLKVTCLLKTGDYRSALDSSLMALSLSQTQNDVLSFMYSQAEAHLRLKEYSSAKTVLKKILSIDASYRLTKERLDRLNAV